MADLENRWLPWPIAMECWTATFEPSMTIGLSLAEWASSWQFGVSMASIREGCSVASGVFGVSVSELLVSSLARLLCASCSQGVPSKSRKLIKQIKDFRLQYRECNCYVQKFSLRFLIRWLWLTRMIWSASVRTEAAPQESHKTGETQHRQVWLNTY